MKNRAVFGLLASVALATGAWGAVAASAGASPVGDDGGHKIGICHATSSQTNPYEAISVDVDGLNGHGDHTGPLFQEGVTTSPNSWGDIIPPTPDLPNGSQAWQQGGAPVLRNGCVIEFTSLSLAKVVVAAPAGTPIDGAIPATFSAHVSCDDLTSTDVTFPGSGGAGTPTLDHIQVASICTVVENGTDGFPTGTVVTYSPAGADSSGIQLVKDPGDGENSVTITNDFSKITVAGEVVAKAPTPVVTAPALTG